MVLANNNNNFAQMLQEADKVVLVCCGDPRIRGSLARALCCLGFAGSIFRQTYPGSSKAIVDPARTEANIANIGDFVSLGGEMIVLAHHGMTCHAYGPDQDRQLPDLAEACELLCESLDVPVVGLWQDNPSLPEVDVRGIWV